MRPLGPGATLAPAVRVLEHLHRSQRLDVYDAWCDRRACRVAAKVLRPDRLRDRSARRALLAEGRLLRRLCHPHLVRGYDVHDGERPAIVVEALGGATLEHLAETRTLNAAELRHLAAHLASALRYLHGEGIVHLDVKPSNVIADGGRAKLIDRSIARRPGRTPAGRGTWCTMAPEQARGGTVGPAADVWGLGVTLWHAATGANPFEHLPEDHPQPSHRAAPLRDHRRLPARLATIIDASLELDARHRPAIDDILAAVA
jgi:eukaryotic-like serine/threonine-protein kinase